MLSHACMQVLSHPHFLLVTLVLCNAAATEARCHRPAVLSTPACTRRLAASACWLLPLQALPIFLDRLADPITAVLISITVVLIFGARLMRTGAAASLCPHGRCSRERLKTWETQPIARPSVTHASPIGTG